MRFKMYTTSTIYSDNFIKEVVCRVRSGELTVRKAQKLYGIGGNMTIYRWLDCVNIDPKKGIAYKMTKKLKSPPEEDQEQALKESRIKLEYYETILSLAKEEYGLDLKKILASRSMDSKKK